MMRAIAIPLAAALLALAPTPATAQAPDDVQQRMDAARAAAVEFGASLLATLQQAIAAGGAENALEVCKVAAPEIAAQKSAERKLTIGRTSLKLRQPKNKPDDWELRQLQRFEARKAAGENPAGIEIGEYVDSGGKRLFRYMKAIPTAPLCLNCHGASLAPEVAAKLKALYPEDAATGFKPGDLRGAFTIVQTP
jgi:hypothetical protein